MENKTFEFEEQLNDLESHIFNFILDNLSDVPSDLSKDDQIDFIISNYSQSDIDNLIEEYNIYEIETTDALNDLDEEVFDLLVSSLNVPDYDMEEQIDYIITNSSKEEIDAIISECESKIEFIGDLEDIDNDKFTLISQYFNLSDELDDEQSIRDYILENYTLSQIITANDIIDYKLDFYNELIGFESDVFSFICFNYSSLDYNNFKDLERQDTRHDQAFYLISNYSPYELNQTASDFINKREIYERLKGLDEVLFRILIRNMNAYSFFLTRPDITYNLIINYSDYIINIELDKAETDFKVYDDLRNLDDYKLLFLANYLNAPDDLIDEFVNESEFDANIFKNYDVNPKNHIISFNISQDEEIEDESTFKKNDLFKFNNYFEQNPLDLTPKEKIAYYIYKNKSVEDIIEGLNSVPNDMDNVLEDLNNNSDDKDNDNPDSDDRGDNLNNDKDKDKLKIEIIGDESDNPNQETDENNKSDGLKIEIIEDDDEDKEKSSDANSDIIKEIPDDEFKARLNELDSEVFKILSKKLSIIEDNKVAIIDKIVANYNYSEIDYEIKQIEFKIDEYNKLNALDAVTFELLLKKFPRVNQSAGRFERTDELVNNYSFKFIEDTLSIIERDVSDVKSAMANEDLFFEMARFFKLPLHASKEEQINHMLLDNSISTIKNMITVFEGKLKVEGFITGIIDKDKIDCPHCGSKVRKNDKYCPTCGEKLSVTINID